MKRLTPIVQWLQRGTNSEALIYKEKRIPNFELGGFITLDKPIPVYESQKISAESLETSWNSFNEYMSDAMGLLHLNLEEMVCLDNYEIDLLKEKLGDGPTTAYPIYFITIRERDKSQERIVYIGKNSSKTQRFKAGHSALTKLHNPEYDNLEKNIYLANIILLTDEHYLPLEWVYDLNNASKILNEIEDSRILVSSKGFEIPLYNNNKEGNELNRRVEFIMFNNQGVLNDL